MAPGFATAEATPLLFGAHDPGFFLVGHRDLVTTARFQFSFKYMLFDQDSIPTDWFPPLSGMHFAYTQTVIWDLSSQSKPFRDTSYRPALVWDWKQKDASSTEKSWSLQAGFEHESNGKQDVDSRSINTAYLEPHWHMPLDQEGKFLKVGVRAFTYLDRSENPDIVDYRGHTSFLMSTGKPDGAQYRLIWRQGRSADRYSLQLDTSYPLRRQYFANTGGYVYAQIFSGYGETLLDYTVKRPPQLRLGFAVIR